MFRKYFLKILTLVCGVLLVSGGINRYFSYQQNKSALASLQQEKARAAAAAIARLLPQIMQRLESTEPTRPDSGGDRGVVSLAEVNLRSVWAIVEGIKPGQNGRAYVVDGSGLIVGPPGILHGSGKAESPGLTRIQAPPPRAPDVQEVAVIARDFSGAEVLRASADIAATGWKVVVEQPAADISPEVNATLLSTGALMLVGLFVSAFTALWFARDLVHPIRTLQEGAQRIGAGELNLRIEVRTDDELELLADQFNDMAETLRESYSSLEHKVEQRTQELSASLARQTAISVENERLLWEIQQKSRQLEIADKHRSEFLASMSHELRTPLNAVIGFSDVLLQKMFGDMNEKQVEYVKDIHASGQHLLSLINDILDLAKVESGRMELDLGVFDLNACIDNALTLVRERAMKHGISLASNVDAQVGEMTADERKIKQILLNLLSNAVKFTPNGGKIRVDANLIGGAVEIAVSDTGIGIARPDQALVFEEFRQVGSDFRRREEGSGLGLALARKFVELHGGTIGLESEPGKGSKFTFCIPLRPADPAAPPAASQAAA